MTGGGQIAICGFKAQRTQHVGVVLSVSVSALCLFAAACGSTPAPEPIIRTVEVFKPTPVSCIGRDFAAAPVYPDTRESLKAAPSAEDRYQLMSAGWFPRDARLAFLEATVENCKRIAPPPDG